jgi:ribonuclease P protein component
VLARENRLVSADDFRSTMKAGSKQVRDHVIIYLQRDEAKPHTRFGFVVGKPVAGAVGRNLVKRRLRSVAAELLTENPANLSIVIRALPGAAETPWNRLREEVITAVNLGIKKRPSA